MKGTSRASSPSHVVGIAGRGGHFVYFDDVAAYAFDDLVDQTIDLIAALPGVESVYRQDRELIRFQGTALDLAAIDRHLQQWWHARLVEIATDPGDNSG
jgi:hypothetical protein